MATHDYDIANQSGANFRTDLNNVLDAIVSNNSNSSDPSTTFAYMWWVDTSNNVLKLRNSANNAWITLPMSITASNTITPTLNMGTGAEEDVKIVFDGNAQDFYIALDDSEDDLIIGKGSTVGTTPAITIDENLKSLFGGDVEIGTTAPKINLKNTDTSVTADQSLGVFEVESSDGSTGSAGTIAKLDIAASGTFDGSGTGSQFRFSTGATNQSGSIALTEQLRLSDIGNLHLSGGSDRRIQLGSGGAGANTVGNNTVHIRGDGTSMKFMAASGGGYNFEINGTEVARIDNNGDMAVGTTDTTSAFTVAQGDNDNPVARFDMTAAVNAIVGMQIRVTDGTSNANNKFFIRGLDNTNVDRFMFTTNGGLHNYQANDSNMSDERLKENIEDVGDCLDLINKLQVKTFRYKDQHDHDTKIHTGLIAQEVEQIDPSLINQTSNGFGESPEGEEPYKTIYTTDLMHKMLKAIQEQQTQIEALQSEINTLKGG